MAERYVQPSYFSALTIKRSVAAGTGTMLLFFGACGGASDGKEAEKPTGFSHHASNRSERPSRPKVNDARQIHVPKNKPVDRLTHDAKPRHATPSVGAPINREVQESSRDRKRSEGTGRDSSVGPAPPEGPTDQELVEGSSTPNPSAPSGPSDAELAAE